MGRHSLGGVRYVERLVSPPTPGVPLVDPQVARERGIVAADLLDEALRLLRGESTSTASPEPVLEARSVVENHEDRTTASHQAVSLAFLGVLVASSRLRPRTVGHETPANVPELASSRFLVDSAVAWFQSQVRPQHRVRSDALSLYEACRAYKRSMSLYR